jgi:hypothetical protein
LQNLHGSSSPDDIVELVESESCAGVEPGFGLRSDALDEFLRVEPGFGVVGGPFFFVVGFGLRSDALDGLLRVEPGFGGVAGFFFFSAVGDPTKLKGDVSGFGGFNPTIGDSMDCFVVDPTVGDPLFGKGGFVSYAQES